MSDTEVKAQEVKAQTESTVQSSVSSSETTETVKSESSQPVTTSSGKSSKRLTRDGNNKMLGGVCSGIANYFDMDPVLIRVIFAVALFGFGVGPLAYILMWIIMPEA